MVELLLVIDSMKQDLELLHLGVDLLLLAPSLDQLIDMKKNPMKLRLHEVPDYLPPLAHCHEV